MFDIQSFKRGDQGAFTKVFREFYQRIYYFCLKLISNEQEAQDITSDTFLILWTNREKMQSLYNIQNYLYTVSRNKCTDYLRLLEVKQQSRKELLYLSNESTIDNEEINAEVIDSIYKNIKNLPKKYNQVMTLLYVNGTSKEMAARKMNISVEKMLGYRKAALVKLKSNKQIRQPSLIDLLRHKMQNAMKSYFNQKRRQESGVAVKVNPEYWYKIWQDYKHDIEQIKNT